MSGIVSVSNSAAVVNMEPGIAYVPPSPPSTPAKALPVTAPVLGLALDNMTVLIYGNVQASANNNPSLTLTVK